MLVFEVVVAVLSVEERSEDDAEVDEKEVRKEGERGWTVSDGSGGGIRRVITLVVEALEEERARGLGGSSGTALATTAEGDRGGLGFSVIFKLATAASQSNGTAVDGLIADGTDTSSKDSAMLAESISARLVLSVSVLDDGFARLGTSKLFPSDESETE